MKFLIAGTALAAAVCIALWLLLERSLWPRRSTVAFWRLSDLSRRKKAEGYFYGARSHWYLKPATWTWMRRYLRGRESADTYHGKVLPQEDARRLIRLNAPVRRDSLDQVIPYPVAKSLILNHPLPSLAVMECPCRAQKRDACQPRDVCLIVGEPFVSFAVDHQPQRARRISPEEAIDILDQSEKRGHIHTAWFKEVMHNRFYAICNCCACCCLGMASYNRGVPRLIHSGYQPVMEPGKCKSCGKCVSICPFDAWSGPDDQPPRLAEGKCLGCGLCVSHCPTRAVRLIAAPLRGVPLAVSPQRENAYPASG